MRRNKTKTILGVITAVFLIVLFGLGLYAYENIFDGGTGFAGQSQEENDVLYIGDEELELTHNLESYLLIGTDDTGNEDEDAQESDEYMGKMADFLLLFVMDKTDDTYGFLQLNRDTITEITLLLEDGSGEATADEQLCTAHTYGGTPERGCQNTVDAVSQMLGDFPIDGYYSIHMSDVGILNHAVDGVQVSLEEDFSGSDPQMTSGRTLTLTDEQAQIYVRARMDVGDGENTSRMERQLQFMKAFKAKAMKKLDEDSSFADDLFSELEEGSAVTDIPQSRISVIANQMYKGKDLGILQIEGKVTEGMTLGDGIPHAEFYPDERSIASVMRKLCGVEN